MNHPPVCISSLSDTRVCVSRRPDTVELLTQTEIVVTDIAGSQFSFSGLSVHGDPQTIVNQINALWKIATPQIIFLKHPTDAQRAAYAVEVALMEWACRQSFIEHIEAFKEINP